MVLVTQNTLGGLGQGIQNFGSQIGGALQNALQGAAARRREQSTGKALSSAVGPDTLLGKILQIPGASSMLGDLSPFLKAIGGKEGGENANTFFSRYSPQPTPSESPLGAIKSRGNAEIQEDGEITTPSGTFTEEDVIDLPGYGKVLQRQIADALKHNDPTVQKWGQGALAALQDKIKSETPSESISSKIHAASLAKNTIEKMKEDVGFGGAGTTFGEPLGPFGKLGKLGERRAAFEKRGQSLIPLVSAGVQIRNQKEFDEYKSIITNPNSSYSQIQGALNGLEDLISGGLDEYRKDYPQFFKNREGRQIGPPKEEEIQTQTYFDALPAAKEFKGKIVVDEKTGEEYKSDGKRWRRNRHK